MADELTHLGVNWVEESALRNDVAAMVDAKADAEAATDEEELRRRWLALEEMERVVANIRSQLQDPVGDAAVLRFQLAKAAREVESRAKLLHRWQLEVETRKRRRVEEAKRRQCEEAIARQEEEENKRREGGGGGGGEKQGEIKQEGKPQGQMEPLVHSVCAPAVPALPFSPMSPAAPLPKRMAEPATPMPRTASEAVRRGLANILPNNNNNNNNNSGSKSLTAPISQAEYAGGPILPSAYRVTLSRSDVRAKSRKYADDADIISYHARQEKRRRLEEAAATLGAATASAAPLPIKNEDPHMGGEVRVKRGRRDHGEDIVSAVKEEGGGVEVIDVDALMEEADDRVGEETLRRASAGRIAANVLTPARGHTTTVSSSTSASVAAARHEEPMVPLGTESFALPATIYHRLLDYQRDGVRWLLQLHAQRSGGILGDEMGLGKTIQIAAMLNALHGAHELHGPCLIVAPLTVLRQWVAELHRWAPYVRACVMHESSASSISRAQLLDSVRGTPAVVLTTYTALRQHCRLLHAAGFHYIVLDEGHKISNPDATVTLAAKSFPTPHRLILSGTPIQNALKELWCLFDFVKPGLLGTVTKFVSEFEEPINASKNARSSPLVLATAVECARALQRRIAPFLFRRLKKDVVAHALPQKFERVIRCPLSDAQLELYVMLLASPRVQRLMSHTLSYARISGGLNRDGRDASGSLHTAGRRFHLMRGSAAGGIRLESFRVLNELRQICNHADIYRVKQSLANSGSDNNNMDDYDYDDDDHDNDDVNQGALGKRRRGPYGSSSSSSPSQRFTSLRSNRIVNYDGSGKLHTLWRLLAAWRRGGQRVLVFSQTRMMLDIIENMCEQEGHTYIRMDGSTNGHHRQELMDRFNEDSSIFAALLTTRVGGIGVNLIGANRVVIFDPDWNPVTDKQARERAWRIGQTRDVSIYRFIASGTVEEAILLRQLAKTYVTDKVLQNPALQRFFHQDESITEIFHLGAEYDSRVPQGKKHVMAAQEFPPMFDERPDDNDDGVKKEKNNNNNNNNNKLDSNEGLDAGEDADETATVKRETGAAVCHVRSREVQREEPAGPRGETKILRDLMDGRGVRVAGADPVAWRLARLEAQQTMLRVSGAVRLVEHQQEELRQRLREEK